MPPELRSSEDDRPWTTSERLIGGGFSLLFFGLLAAEVVDDWTPARLSIPVFVLSWAVLTAIHEIGHAVVASALGWRVDQLRVGFGPLLRQLEWRGVSIELRAFPIVGLVGVTPSGLHLARTKNAAIYAAGPGIELLLAAAVGTVVGWQTLLAASDSLAIVSAQAFCIAALFGALLNLIPLSPQPGLVTDGLGIALSPFLPRSHFEAQMMRPTLAEGARLLRVGEPGAALTLLEQAAETYPEVLLLQSSIARALVDLGRTEEALLRLRACTRTSDPRDRRDGETALTELRAYIQQCRERPMR